MIVVDTSSVVAIFRQEDDAARHAQAIGDDEEPRMSAAGVLETSMVLRGLKQISAAEAERWLDEFLRAGTIQIDPVTSDQTALARQAHMRFGKGTGHVAQPNFGDCFAYALAKALDAPLLFKGADFPHTDIKRAL
jgi:ribonuclease VapC